MEQHYHLIGIGGIGMGALASLLLEKGYRVSGSDVKKSKMVDALIEKGAHVTVGHQADHCQGADYVVYSSAIPEDNCELLAAQKQGISLMQRAQLLADLMKDYTSITIAGAHGKTTTTSMISHLLCKANLSPTCAVGGIVNSFSSNVHCGDGKYFVAEVDESDGSFLYFSPQYSVITNIDFEHIDHYCSWEEIINTYRKYIQQTAAEGQIIACGEDKHLRNLLKETDQNHKWYGFDSENYVAAKNITFDNMKTSFDCVIAGDNYGKVFLNIPGEHNILNALACICLGNCMGIDFEVIRESLSEFSGVQRRFQLKGKVDDIVVIDDYAHHPTEIRATLKTAKQLPHNRLVAVFQPHRYSRVHGLMEEFLSCFESCDYLIITDIYAASENPIEGISAQALAEKIRSFSQKKVDYVPKEKISDHLLEISESSDIILTIGAGDITAISEEFLKKLKNNATKV